MTERESNGIQSKKKMQMLRSHLKKMTREALSETVLKRKKCIQKAQEIVLCLIEAEVDKSWMMDNLIHINQTHFDDAIEERFLSMVCSYPLCNKMLSNIPKQQYVISTRVNKVYDITERKKYCSDFCYKACTFIRNQLYTSPLWLRDYVEGPLHLQLYDVNNVASSGDAMDISLTEKSIPINSHKCEDNTGTDSTMRLTAFIGEPGTIPEQDLTIDFLEGHSRAKEMVSSKQKINIIEEVKCKESSNGFFQSMLFEEPSLSVDIREKEKPGQSMNSKAGNVNEVKTKSLLDTVMELETKVKSWFTVDTLVFCLGEDTVKDSFSKFGVNIDIKPQKDPFIVEKYNEMCSKLCEMEIVNDLEESGKLLPVRHPIPHFQQLREEAKDVQIKVKQFFRGDKVVSFQDQVEEQDTEPQETFLPLIHHQAVQETRRSILLKTINKSLPDFQELIGLGNFDLSTTVKRLVATLNLTPSNILLRPSEMNLVSLYILKLLTVRDEQLKLSFKSERVFVPVRSLLEAFELDVDYLERLLSYLFDLTPFLPHSPPTIIDENKHQMGEEN